MPKLRVTVLLAVAASLTGCAGGGESAFYAGVDEGEVPQEAMTVIGREVRAPESPLFEHRVEYLDTVRGRNSLGDEAWRARIQDRTDGRLVCVYVWATTALTVRTYEAEIDYCEPAADEQAAPPAPA